MTEIVERGYTVEYFIGTDPQWSYVVRVRFNGVIIADSKFATRPWANAFYFDIINRIKRGEECVTHSLTGVTTLAQNQLVITN